MEQYFIFHCALSLFVDQSFSFCFAKLMDRANTWVEGDLVPEVAMVVVAVEEIFQQVFLVCNLRLDWCS
ncbi:hypothetical protein HanRHA438_Chr08g0348291 [Helianthus annuus]|nr:hypothetical protein HanRHA438_Chr08g0348291 [Helianthus annuus]